MTDDPLIGIDDVVGDLVRNAKERQPDEIDPTIFSQRYGYSTSYSRQILVSLFREGKLTRRKTVRGYVYKKVSDKLWGGKK